MATDPVRACHAGPDQPRAGSVARFPALPLRAADGGLSTLARMTPEEYLKRVKAHQDEIERLKAEFYAPYVKEFFALPMRRVTSYGDPYLAKPSAAEFARKNGLQYATFLKLIQKEYKKGHRHADLD